MEPPLLCIVFLLLSVCLLNLSKTEPTEDSPESMKLRLVRPRPFPNASQALSSDFHRLSALLHRRPSPFRTPIVSGASIGSGQYLVHLLLGSPPQRLLLVADTGSDLVWSKCSASRKTSSSFSFRPRLSSSFSPLHCYDRSCSLVPPPPGPSPTCNRSKAHSPCRYSYSYADSSSSSGLFSRDTATLHEASGRRQIRLPNLAFGCGFHFSGQGFSGAHGVLGLGRGPTSFSSQISRKLGSASSSGRFSYCLMDYTLSPPPTSYLVLGAGGSYRRPPVRSTMSFTPLQTNPFSPTFYYVQILSVSVDGRILPIDPSVWALDGSGNGGTVIDSGTTLSFLTDPAYRQILTAFGRRVRLPRVVGPPASGFDLCVNVTGARRPRLPRLGFRFLGGAAFVPPARNYFIDAANGVKCLALQAVSSPSFSVIGNLMQQGFLLEFDLVKSRLGFSRTECRLS